MGRGLVSWFSQVEQADSIKLKTTVHRAKESEAVFACGPKRFGRFKRAVGQVTGSGP
jgi:hypothetical protein